MHGYAQVHMKEEAWAWLGKHCNTLPPWEKIVLCANCELAVNDSTNKDAILFYIDVMMPKMMDKARDFSKKIWYYYD